MQIDFTKSFFVEPGAALASSPARVAVQAAPLVDPARSALWLRALLLLGVVLAVVAAVTAGDPAPYLNADPELAMLLRGMAVLKALMVAAGLGVLGWRFGQAITARTAALYLGGAWLVAGATALIWQLSWLPLAALVFHVAGFMLLIVAFADARGGPPPAGRVASA